MLTIAEAKLQLLEDLHPGDTVWTILRHAAASGMTRWISPVIPQKALNGRTEYWLVDLTYTVSVAMHCATHERWGGIKRPGFGMDMGFELVYSLSRTLWPGGFPCIGELCPSNDHSNGDRDYTPGHVTHGDGGYALQQRWL